MAILQRTVKHSRIKLKNWCVLATFAALSAEKTTPLDPIILLVPTTDGRPPRDSHHDKRPNQPTNQDPQSAHTNITPVDPPLRDTINTIYDGFASGGSTSYARKRRLRHI